METIAAKSNKRATAWARDVIYDRLQQECEASVYELAKALDEAEWKQSVRNRVTGRQKARQLRASA